MGLGTFSASHSATSHRRDLDPKNHEPKAEKLPAAFKICLSAVQRMQALREVPEDVMHPGKPAEAGQPQRNAGMEATATGAKG